MTDLPDAPPRVSERRVRDRSRFDLVQDAFFAVTRRVVGRAADVRKALGLFILGGATLAVIATWAFAKVADEVREGATRPFDEAVLRWAGAHRLPWLDAAFVEITALGTAAVVVAVVGIAALFLSLTKHRYSALLLLVSSGGGIVLNNILKLGFNRPRPQVIAWGTHAMTSSFPSGHAMSAAIVYGTVAYLAARLATTHATRIAIGLVAAALILLISASRVYLGVHYPSDILAGMLVGAAWAGFCMATLEALQLYARRRAPQVLEQERPPEKSE